ncbi:hypothetical protein Q9966_007177 [Columba livia]|nr:hypothetical protein Q9966_007177 [Columba livia]
MERWWKLSGAGAVAMAVCCTCVSVLVDLMRVSVILLLSPLTGGGQLRESRGHRNENMMRLLCGGFLNKKALLFLRQKCHEEPNMLKSTPVPGPCGVSFVNKDVLNTYTGYSQFNTNLILWFGKREEFKRTAERLIMLVSVYFGLATVTLNVETSNIDIILREFWDAQKTLWQRQCAHSVPLSGDRTLQHMSRMVGRYHLMGMFEHSSGVQRYSGEQRSHQPRERFRASLLVMLRETGTHK